MSSEAPFRSNLQKKQGGGPHWTNFSERELKHINFQWGMTPPDQCFSIDCSSAVLRRLGQFAKKTKKNTGPVMTVALT